VGLQTPFHREDAIEQLMKDPQWHGLRFGCFDENGDSRWPQRFPTAVLEQEKQSHIMRGQYRLWMREWECKIVAGEDKCFNVQNLVHYLELPDFLRVVIAIDPASSERKTADDHAIVALGFYGNEVFVLDYKLSKATMPDKAIEDLFTLILLYRPIKIVIESISYQRVLKWMVEQEMQKKRIFVTVDAVQDRRSKASRITQALVGLTNFRHLHIRPSMSELINQMDDYDPEVKDQPDDLLDAIAMGITSLNPALRAQTGNTLEGEWSKMEEQEYAELEFGGSP
jgi:phage terminase large subunit-like protein